jgi:parvulin-like peptidyl-prolyl isomerase
MLTTACGKREPELPKTTGDASTTESTTPADKPAGATSGDTTTSGATTIQQQNIETLEKLNAIPSIAEMIKKDNIPRQTVICTVGGDSVNVAEYRHVLKAKQDQIRQVLQQDPSQRIPLLEHAKKDNIQLTDEEKKNLLEQAHSTLGKNLPALLKQNKLTEAQFESQILEMGRALKTATRALEKKLLSELINQALLVDAARNAGMAKTAFNRYIEFKHSPQFEQVTSYTDMTPDQLRDKIIEEYLSEAMQKKIVEAHALPDSKVLEVYNSQKDKFKHPARIKWSQIVIAAPSQDMGAMESIRSQVKRQFPDLDGAALDAKVKETEISQRKKALDALAAIKNGKDFAEVANETTDDLPAKVAKKGGDMGYVGLDEIKKNQLLSKVGDALQNLKVGEVCQEPVQTMFGYHIVKLTGKQDEGIASFAEVKDELKEALAQQQSGMAVGLWLMEKRKSVPIRITKEFQAYMDRNPVPVTSKPATGAATPTAAGGATASKPAAPASTPAAPASTAAAPPAKPAAKPATPAAKP